MNIKWTWGNEEGYLQTKDYSVYFYLLSPDLGCIQTMAL